VIPATRRASAPAKINLALVVGPTLSTGKHEVVTVLQPIDLVDTIELRPSAALEIGGYEGDTIVRAALEALAAEADSAPAWAVRITKGIPVAAGLGGGSSDAATALRLANATLPQPLDLAALVRIAATLGADVPFFLHDGPGLGVGDGSTVTQLGLPQDFHVLLVLPHGATKPSTASVYAAFDEREGAMGFDGRRSDLMRALAGVRTVGDLAGLPRNDLCTSPLAARLERLGAVRADVSGAGPVVYALFEERSAAAAARGAIGDLGATWLAAPP
jgi:4-diphosphocytidyl-2-C-methyl-D-erythritol kinase